MKYELIITDLDGTLLTSEMTVSPENEAAIKKITAMGIEFAVSSGRAMNEIPECIMNNPDIRYITHSNGTAIFDKLLCRDIASNRLSLEEARAAYDVISDYDTVRSIHTNGCAYFNDREITDELCKTYQINDYYRAIFENRDALKSDEACAREIEGTEAVVMFFKNDEDIEPCRKRLEAIGGITVTSSVAHNLELCSSRAGKGHAFEMLREYLGVAKESSIAVGDNMNDTSMFSAAGLSLCVASGNEEAKALADKVICRSDEHIAKYIYEMLTEK